MSVGTSWTRRSIPRKSCLVGSLAGTEWVRKSDGVRVRVVADSDGSGMSHRSILMMNLESGHNFWATPAGLDRKYDAG